MRCPDCRPLILDHIYGLLDAPESTAVEAHLAACPACAAERTEVARMQGLLAKAAKGAFPGVRFEAPGARPAAAVNGAKPTTKPAQTGNTETVAYPAADVVPLTRPASQDRPARQGHGKRASVQQFFSWAVAASILFMLAGAVVLVQSTLTHAEVARKNSGDATEKALAALRDFENTNREAAAQRVVAHTNLIAAKQAHDGLLAKWMEEEKAIAQNQTARKLTWEVLKPAAVQPGAPNEFLLVVRDRSNTPSGRIVAEFRDQTDAVIYTQPINHEREAQHPIRLPASAWGKLKPESELFLVVSRVDEKTSEKTILQDKVKLLGPVFATVLTTDKAEYHPGETVRFRSLTLDRVTFTPPTRDQFLHFELRGPNGALVRSGGIQGGTDLVRVVEGNVTPIHGPDGKPIRGVGTGEFLLPPNAAEGDYTLIMREYPHPSGSPPVVPFPVTRSLKVRTGIAESYFKQIGTTAASYSAGDTVEAWAELKFKDAPVVGAEVSAVAVADEQVLQISDIQPPITDASGRVNLRFTLPPRLENGDVRLKVTFRARNEKDTIEETVADRIPVIGRNIVVEFFPEGGDLVAGVPCKVYVRATTPTGHPVDITGHITDGRRIIVPKVETMTAGTERGANRGIGSFTYTPELGVPVWLKLSSPSAAFSPLLTADNGKFPTPSAAIMGIAAATSSRTGFLLPKVKLEGVVMTVPDPVTRAGEPIRVHLRSVGRERNLVVGAYTRGRLSDTKTVTAKPGMVAEVQLMSSPDPRGGVVRVTVFEEPEDIVGEAKPDLTPVAERLIFRRPGEALNLALGTTGPRASMEGFAPGSQVSLNITATNEKGNPTAAILYAAAVNTAVAPGAKDRLLTTHFLLAGEVNTPDAMEYADFLLTDHPKAPEALDLVLGTQGWRRFAEQVPKNYAKQPTAPTQERANLLVCNGQYMTSAEPTSLHEQQKLRDTYWPRFETAVKNLDAAKVAAEAADADRSGLERAQKLAAVANAACEQARAEAAQGKEALAPVERFRGAGWFAVGGFGLLAALLAVASFSYVSSRLPLGIGSVGSVALAAFLVLALGRAEQTQAAAEASNEVVKLPAGRVSATVPTTPGSVRKATDAQADTLAMGVPAKNNQSDKPGTGKDGQGKANGIETGAAAPGFGGGAAGGGGGAAQGGFAFGSGLGGPQAVNVNPGKRLDAKEERANPPGPPRGYPPAPHAGGAPNVVGQPPAAPGAAGPLKFVGDGGWQPGAGRKPVPDELLAKGRELARLLKDRKASDAAKGVGLSGVPPKEAGLSPDARAATDRHEKRDSEQYWTQFEKAKKQAEAKADQFRRRIDEVIEQQGTQRDEDKAVPTDGVNRLQGKVELAESVAAYRLRQAIPTVPPLVVREYAAPRPGTTEKENAQLTGDTILWQPIIVLPSDGKVTLNMHVGSAPGGYQVIVAGHTLDGRIGATRGLIPIALPLGSETNPVLPGKP